ncbi:PVC-type heme-binding CxxCH protein [Verrucomicrobiaceae bacterium 227]
MKRLLLLLLPLALVAFLSLAQTAPKQPPVKEGPLRILFLGHDQEHHNSNEYFPMISEALGREAIYFDYHTDVEEALGDYGDLSRFDGVLLYANHETITPKQFSNLTRFVEEGGGFIPVHCASACFNNEPAFVKLVGGKFAHHQGKDFTTTIIEPGHPAMKNVKEFTAWDETYVHSDQTDDRNILMVRKPGGQDNVTEPEPWTWTREQEKGRVFYTASGHDQRVWKLSEFHQLLKSGILWAVGDERLATYQKFTSARTPLKYEKRENIPNYEKRPEPLPFQLPLSPEDSMSYTQVPVGWKLKLFASEPDIINPIYMQWDERGRLWVLETIDYPNEVRSEEPGDDSLKILEDTNGDGKCDKVTVFADKLNIPTSFTFANGGIYLHQAPHTIFLKDTDGDDMADQKEIVLSGWGTNDTHAGPSNLRYGIDNQLWGTVGYSGFSKDNNRFGMGIYRFTKDLSKIEFLHQFNNNTWGLGFNDQGDVFGSTANRHPSFFGGIPATVHPGGKGLTAKSIANTEMFQPITPNVRQVDVFGGYTAAAGHAFANSNNFPESWRGKMAFVNGPTGNLLGKFQTVQDGAGHLSKNRHSLIASADEHFSPIAAEVGPDGNLWIADWYNFIIQHNPTPNTNSGGYKAVTGKGNAHTNPNRDRSHGRIYRLVWEGAKPSPITSLANATTARLVAALSDTNQFWRLTAQRLLVDGKKSEATPALQALIAESGPGAIHALWTLHGLNALDDKTSRAALLSKNPALRRNAIRALTSDQAGADLLFESAVINDPNLETRLAAFVALCQIPTSDALKQAISGLLLDPINQKDEWLLAALKAAAATHGVNGNTEMKPGPDLFEKAQWRPTTYNGKASFKTNEGIMHISSEKGADASYSTRIKVQPNTDYRLQARIRTQNIKGAMGALLNVHELQGTNRVLTKALKGKNDWTEVSIDFNTAGHRELTFNALFGGWGQSTGQAWYSNVELHELTPVPVESSAGEKQQPDAVRGKNIFLTHQTAACNRCHQVEGQGGVIGPALDGIGARKGADYLLQSLVEPGAAIAEGYPGEVSPMPPMNLLLTDQEIADVLEYLKELK